MVKYGWPVHWVEALGARILKFAVAELRIAFGRHQMGFELDIRRYVPVDADNVSLTVEIVVNRADRPDPAGHSVGNDPEFRVVGVAGGDGLGELLLRSFLVIGMKDSRPIVVS